MWLQIPLEFPEDLLLETFRAAVGDIVQFRLLKDATTGKPQGSGLCDFASPEAAQNAIRILSGSDINGQKIRAEVMSSTSADGKASSDNVKQLRDIETALAQLSVNELYDVLVEVKAWVARDPEGVRDLLAQRPVVAQALLKMQAKMGMLRTPPPVDSSYGSSSFYSPPVMHQPTPVVAPAYYHAPPLPQAPMMYRAPQVDPQAYALLNQALNMTEEQISLYPIDQQNLFRKIRASAGRR